MDLSAERRGGETFKLIVKDLRVLFFYFNSLKDLVYCNI